jgi:hypothetical protein
MLSVSRRCLIEVPAFLDGTNRQNREQSRVRRSHCSRLYFFSNRHPDLNGVSGERRARLGMQISGSRTTCHRSLNRRRQAPRGSTTSVSGCCRGQTAALWHNYMPATEMDTLPAVGSWTAPAEGTTMFDKARGRAGSRLCIDPRALLMSSALSQLSCAVDLQDHDMHLPGHTRSRPTCRRSKRPRR